MKDSRRSRLAAKLVLAATIVFVPPAMAADTAEKRPGRAAKAFRTLHSPGIPNYDVRDTKAGRARAAKRSTARRSAQSDLRLALGKSGVVSVDRVTGTPSYVGSRGGFLTDKSSKKAPATALDYVHRNAAAFGLDDDDIADLEIVKRYTTRRGLTHIEWHQVVNGVPAYDNVLRANVVKGRLVNLSGAPASDLARASTTPELSAVSAVRRALADVGVRREVKQVRRRGRNRFTVVSGGNLAELVLFTEGGQGRPAWSVIARKDNDEVYRTVVDAGSGEILVRRNLVAQASLRAHDYFPGSAAGGVQSNRTVPTTGADPWLATPFDKLLGDNAWTYNDSADGFHLQCDNMTCPGPLPDPGDTDIPQIRPTANSGTAAAEWHRDLLVGPADTGNFAGRSCPAFGAGIGNGCSWNGFGTGGTSGFGIGDNWQRNVRQNGAQAHFFVNNFHDFTQNDPGISFDDASGNFEHGDGDETNASIEDNDRVHVQVDDGSSTDGADFPDAEHTNNANMLTLAETDGVGAPTPYPERAPSMQMYLFSDFGVGQGITDVNGGDDAAIVYHEFTHGLSNRLVDPFGTGGLFTAQGGAMGEAWSDWYAMDYLHQQGFQPDGPNSDVTFGTYEGMEGLLRTQAMDCPVFNNPGSSAEDPTCQGGSSPHFGAYTYGDFGTIGGGGPEVHDDGEIWAGTLWDLRRALITANGLGNGTFEARALVTDAMRLSPSAPSFIDMRDAILAAGVANGFGPATCQTTWSVFARRGMGLGASATDPDDTSPVESFSNPGADPAFCPVPSGGGGTGGGGTGGGGTGGGAGGGSTTAPTAPAKANLSRAKRSIKVKRGRFTYRFRGGAGLTGSAVFKSIKKVKVSARRKVTLAKKSFTVPSSGKVTLKIKLSKKNLRILRRNRKIKLRVTVKLRNAAGLRSTATRTLTLRI